jgi:hypothetical protein
MVESRICAACGGGSPPDSNFCQHCGANLPPVDAAPQEFYISDRDELQSVANSNEDTTSQTLIFGDGNDGSSESNTLQASFAEATSIADESEGVDRGAVHQDNFVDGELVAIGEKNVLTKIGAVTVNGNFVLKDLADQSREQRASEEGHVALDEVLSEEWQWVQRAFVKPLQYQEQWRRMKAADTRVFVVYGPEHAGKYTCALHLGLDLLTEAGHNDMRLTLFEPSRSDIRSLPSFTRSGHLDKNTVYIIRDAFENGVQISDLCQPLLQTVNAALESDGNYLILTATQLGQLDLDALQVNASVNMRDVFDHYLKLYESDSRFGPVSSQLLTAVRVNIDNIRQCLRWPFHALSFGLQLKMLDPDATQEAIMQSAKQAGRVDQRPARAWFASLPDDNTRLYAMLVALFRGINRFQLDELYTSVVQWLRKDGVTTLRDPREIGLTDLLERIGAVIEANQVRFSDEDYSQQIEREIDNHHHLLWSLKDLILSWAREYSAPENWELRRNLGAAIGRLGIYYLDKLRTVLQELAYDDNSGVVAVVGYALDAVCRLGARYQTFALELLDRWVKSGDPRLMWAAGASVWRLYDGLLETVRFSSGQHEDGRRANEALRRARGILTRLTERFDNFEDAAKSAVVAAVLAAGNGRLSVAEVRRRTQKELDRWAEKTARSVLHAIRRMALSDTLGIVELIGVWLDKEEGTNLRGIGRLAAYQEPIRNFVCENIGRK